MINFLLLLLGSVILLKYIYQVALIIKIHQVKLDSNWTQRFGEEPWAIITGCTGGIGKQFCLSLSELGFNLILVARNQKAIDEVIQQVQFKSTVQCKKFILDFERSQYEDYSEIQKIIKDLNIRMLINNVGFPSLNQFKFQSEQQIYFQLNVNIKAMTFLSHILIPYLIRDQCGIINMSSMSVMLPFSTTPVYVGSKGYDDILSQSLSLEFKDKIQVLSVKAGVVKTPATKYSKEIVACSAEECVSGSLKALGVVRESNGYISHNIQAVITRIIGQKILKYLLHSKCQQVIRFLKG